MPNNYPQNMKSIISGKKEIKDNHHWLTRIFVKPHYGFVLTLIPIQLIVKSRNQPILIFVFSTIYLILYSVFGNVNNLKEVPFLILQLSYSIIFIFLYYISYQSKLKLPFKTQGHIIS